MKKYLPILLLLIIAFLSLTACGSEPTEEIAATKESPTTETPTKTPATPTDTPTTAPSATPTDKATSTPPPTAIATATSSTATPEPSPTPIVYIIEEYDTLLDIAIEFETTTDAILAANGLNENDFLQIGQKLIIPTDEEEIARLLEQEEEGTSATPQTESDTASAQAPPPSPTPSGPPPPTITHAANVNPLTGLKVDDPGVLKRRPLFVRVGNDVGARPQVGLNSADVVYEEITEWWITRFTAVYLSQDPEMVAPIRSARLSNIQLVPQYKGALAHSGGSDPVRWEISQAPITNLDEFFSPKPYFYRANQGWQSRLALNVQDAREYMEDNDLEAPVKLQGFLFDETINQGEPAENIYIPYPRTTSFTQWRYFSDSGQYLRWISDEPLIDASDNEQVSADNVIIYFAEHQDTDILDVNGIPTIRIIMNGRGPAWFFRDGVLNKGYWQTDGSRTPYFAYEDGTPYNLKPGRTWIEVVPTYFTIGLNSAGEASANP